MAIANQIFADPKNFKAATLVNRLREPMKTRVTFYLQKLQERKTDRSEGISQDDMDKAIGRAYQDKMEDQEVPFDRDQVLNAISDIDSGRNVTNLRELVHGLSG